MKQAALSQFNMTWIPITGLIIFVACFALYAYWTYKDSNKEHFKHASNVPLDDAKLKGDDK